MFCLNYIITKQLCRIAGAVIICLFFVGCKAHSQWIDSLPFSTELGLITIQGKVNNEDASFLIDTGAGITVVTNSFRQKAKLKASSKSVVTRDANQNKERLQRLNIQRISIGKAVQKKVPGVAYDMQYLKCMDLQILGENFLKYYNWRIDFTTNMVSYSPAVLPVDAATHIWKIDMSSGRPYVTIYLKGKPFKCLIDLGFRGYLDLKDDWNEVDSLVNEKESNGLVSVRTNRVMGLVSTETVEGIKEFMLDEFTVGNHLYQNVPVTVGKYEGAKIGWMFLERYASAIIINHGTGEILLEMRAAPVPCRASIDAGFQYQNGELIVSDLFSGPGSSALSLALGDTVQMIDGKTAKDFGDDCSLLKWHIQNKLASFVVKRKDGTALTIERNGLGCPAAMATY